MAEVLFSERCPRGRGATLDVAIDDEARCRRVRLAVAHGAVVVAPHSGHLVTPTATKRVG